MMDYTRKVAPALFREFVTERRGANMVRHQLDSFDEFVRERIPSIISTCNNIEVHNDWMPAHGMHQHRLTISMENPRMARPSGCESDGTAVVLTPEEARLRGYSYSAPLYVDIRVQARAAVAADATGDAVELCTDEKRILNVCIGRVPIMVRSRYCITHAIPLLMHGECRYDYGGYFIVNGNEKVIVANDRMAENTTFVFCNNKATLTYSHSAEIRSVGWPGDGSAGTVKSLVLRASARPNQFGRYVRVALPHAKQDVPLMLLFRAFGVESDRDIVELITMSLDADEERMLSDQLVGSIAECSDVRCARDALEVLARAMNVDDGDASSSRMDYMRSVISRDILPHAGRDFGAKAVYLGYMVRRLLRCVMGMDEPDDRDSYVSKRVDTPGMMMASLFRIHYVRLVKEMRNSLAREIASGAWKPSGSLINVISKVNVGKHIKASMIESGLKYALATGNWNAKGTSPGMGKMATRKQGVAQVLNRLTYMATLSHLRRINTPMEKNGKMVAPRKLHNTQWGVVCPSECFDPETPILTWEGTIKAAKEIAVGDYLIDDKGNAVRVKSTCKGFKTMYEVVPDESDFMRYTVTDNHILTLKDTTSGDVIDATIEEFQSLPEHVQKTMYVFKSSGINWERKEVAIDPYILGMWLGDDATIRPRGRHAHAIRRLFNGPELAPLEQSLAKYGLVDNKHIPLEYLVNDRETRLAVLAGLVDADGSVGADGHEIRITKGEESYTVIRDAEFLARSLGFSCDVKDGVKGDAYKELTITGARMYELPTVLARNKLHKLNTEKTADAARQSSFKLVPKDVGPFVGWQLDGNGRFLLGDMSVSHNTPEGVSIGLVKNLAMMATITTHADPWLVMHHIHGLGLVSPPSMCDTLVMVNGRIVGSHPDAPHLLAELRRLKRMCVVNVFTSIVLDMRQRVLLVNTEAGRFVRPLLVVDDGTRIRLDERDARALAAGNMPWWKLVFDGKIEYVDVAEANHCMIAMTPGDLEKGKRGVLHAFAYTHMEIDPACIMGVPTSCIPFSDHNQAPRNTYQCLHPDETVLMADGSKKPIKDVCVGDTVVTFDPETKLTRTTSVINQYVRMSVAQAYEIETVSGRKIIATSNHNFMTKDGWKPVSEFDDTTYIGILADPEPVSPFVDDYVILDDAIFRKKMSEFQMPDEQTDTYIRELTTVGLLPLKSTHVHLPVIARMCGFVWADGSADVCLEPQVSADFGCESDAELFEREVGLLGFRTTKPSEQHRELHDHIMHTWKILHDGSFAALLIALDQRLGKRTTTSMMVPVPSWVLNGSLLVKREFLAGFQGGDGCTISTDDGKMSQCPVAYQSCDPDHVQYLLEFLNQMKGMIEELGVEMRTSTFGDNQKKVGYEMSCKPENLVRFFDTVGYRYDLRKATRSAVIVEYLRTKLLREVGTVRDWKETVTVEGNAIFVPIHSVTPVDQRIISDITVSDESHSFIAARGFYSSNSSMSKQAIGVNVSNFNSRFDTVNHILHYPQRALVQTRAAQLFRSDCLPNGINAMVAIMTYTGYNQEDSVLLNRGAIERGMFVSTMFKTFREQNNRNHANGEEEFFCRPDPTTTRNMKPSDYSLLGEDGFVPENTRIQENDIIVGRCMPQKVGADLVFRDNSVPFKGTDAAFVDRNCHDNNYFTTINGDGYVFAKTRVRCHMEPVVGDKFSSRHAQKGTCGMVLNEWDMPWTADGIVPDVIMNTHAIPSRMTIAQMLEGIAAKAACVRGTTANGSAFQTGDFGTVGDVLQSRGIHRHGDEVAFDPVSGRQMDVDVFITPTYYQRLKHLSSQKVHSRGANGPVVMLTRQPTEGRSREGALRQGNMETHVLIAHGVMQFLKERMMECSDNFRVYVCNSCGLIADVNREHGTYVCRTCRNVAVDFSEVRIPYSCKLLAQELYSLGVATRFAITSRSSVT